MTNCGKANRGGEGARSPRTHVRARAGAERKPNFKISPAARATFTVHCWTPFSRTAHARSALGQGLITQRAETPQSTDVEPVTWKDFPGGEDWEYVKADARWRRRIISWGWDLALVASIAAIVMGVWLAFLYWKLSSPMFGMLAVLLVLAGPALAVAVIVVRPEDPGDPDEPPESVLVDNIHRTDASLRIAGLGRAHVGVIASYVVILWICETAGMVSLKGLLVFLTFACAMTAVAYLPWLSARERQLHEKRDELRRRLRDFETTRGG
jgi:hypothetical protein